MKQNHLILFKVILFLIMVVINRIELLFNAYETFVLPLNYMTIVWLLATPSGIEPLFDDYQSSVLPLNYVTINWSVH